ncbi:MAG TPA: TIM-barrel domain-containing protein, partial [Minicystis sp.]|nr:TIM-barrel domain-containing protein [Minicystis sp.]
IWPGDLDNGFETAGGAHVGGLPAAIVAAQTLAASGFPTFGSDTGGFRGGMPTREALLRWAEHTAFSVILELGGGGDHHDPWLYDVQAGQIYAALARQHMQLVPYLDGLLRDAAARGTPTIRSLPLAFPFDGAKPMHGPDDEYLLGPDLLVAPIVAEAQEARVVEFPPGKWEHWFKMDVLSGPMRRMLSAPLGQPLVFARVGALVPLFAADLDTLVTGDFGPDVVTPASKHDVEARWFVSLDEGHKAATWPGGETLVADATSGQLRLAWTQSAGVAVVVDVDLTTVQGSVGLRAGHVSNDASLHEVAGEAAVRAAKVSTYAFSADGQHLYVRLLPGLDVKFTKG